MTSSRLDHKLHTIQWHQWHERRTTPSSKADHKAKREFFRAVTLETSFSQLDQIAKSIWMMSGLEVGYMVSSTNPLKSSLHHYWLKFDVGDGGKFDVHRQIYLKENIGVHFNFLCSIIIQYKWYAFASILLFSDFKN